MLLCVDVSKRECSIKKKNLVNRVAFEYEARNATFCEIAAKIASKQEITPQPVDGKI